MAVFLSILRIIGIVLLCILGAILLMILLVMFVPFRYRVDAGKEDKLHARARVHWLLYFVIVDLLYDDGINMRLRILGIPFYDKKKKEAKAARKREKEEAAAGKKREKEEAAAGKKDENAAGESEAAEDSTAQLPGDSVKDEKPSESSTAAAEEKTEESGASDKKKKRADKKKKKKEEKEKKERTPLGERISAAWDAFTDLLGELPDKADEGIDGLLEKAEALEDKVSELWDTVDYYQRLLGSDGTAWVIDYVKKHVLKILKGVRPRKIKAYLEIRDDDPGQVAKLYQYYAMALPVLDYIPGKVELDAAQDEKSFKFKAMVKGRVFVNTLARHGLALLLNRKVKKFIKLLKRETE